jgi:hypothetical protein
MYEDRPRKRPVFCYYGRKRMLAADKLQVWTVKGTAAEIEADLR